MVKKVRICPKCGADYSSWRMYCVHCNTMLQEAEKKEVKDWNAEEKWAEKRQRLELLQKDLPRHWLRKYLLNTLPIPLIIILIGVIVLWVYKGESEYIFLAFLAPFGVGMFVAILFSLAYAEETPLRKYRLIRKISRFFHEIVKRGPPPV